MTIPTLSFLSMTTSTTRTHRAVGIAIALTMFGACTTRVPAVDAPQTISEAVGLRNAVRFSSVPEPLDVECTEGHLSIADAIRSALLHDPRLQAALARVRIALADAEQARLLPNPILVITLGIPIRAAGPFNVEATLAQDLVALLRRPAKSESADQRLRASTAEAVGIALDVVNEIRDRYVRTQAVERLLPLLRARRSLLERLESLANARLQAGEGTRLDVTTLRAQHAEVEVDIGEAEGSLRELRLEIARRMGAPSAPAEWTIDAPETLGELPFSELQWIDGALLHRPELLRLQWELAALVGERKAAEFAGWDGLGGGGALFGDTPFGLGPAVSAPLPLFDDGSVARRRFEARAIELRHQLAESRREAVEDVRRAIVSFNAARTNLYRTHSTLLPLQRQRLAQVEDVYRAGFSDLTALLLAEQDLRATEAKAVALEERVALSLFRLERAVGGPAAFRDPERAVSPAFSDAPAPTPLESNAR